MISERDPKGLPVSHVQVKLIESKTCTSGLCRLDKFTRTCVAGLIFTTYDMESFASFLGSQSSTIKNVDGWQHLLRLFDGRIACVPTDNANEQIGRASHAFHHWITVFSSYAYSVWLFSPLYLYANAVKYCLNGTMLLLIPSNTGTISPPTRPFSSRNSRDSSGHCRHARRTVIGFSRLLSFPRGKSSWICERVEISGIFR